MNNIEVPSVATVLPDTDFTAQLEKLAREIKHLESDTIFKIALRIDKAHELFLHRRDEGGFRGWCERRLGYSRAHAYRLLGVAKLAKVSQAWDTFGTLPVTAIYQIATAPESAREEILRRLKIGDSVSGTMVSKIIAKANSDANSDMVPAKVGKTTKNGNAEDPEESADARKVFHAAEEDADSAVETSSEIKTDQAVATENESVNTAPATGAAPTKKPSKKDILSVWEESSENREILAALAIEEFFTEANGAAIHERIPAHRRSAVVGEFLDRLGVPGLLAAMSAEFGGELRDQKFAPKDRSKSIKSDKPKFKTVNLAKTVDSSGKTVHALPPRQSSFRQ